MFKVFGGVLFCAVLAVMMLLVIKCVFAVDMVDYNCINNCTQQGNLWAYCNQFCSYKI